MYCPQCGANNDDSARFCATCGLDLGKYKQQWQEPGPHAAAAQTTAAQVGQQPPAYQAQSYQPQAPPPPAYQQSYQQQYQPPYHASQYYPPGPAYGTAPRIKSYMGWAIATLILCFWPTGIVAVVYASQVGSKLSMGDYEGAMRSSHKAKVWTWVTFGVGVAIAVITAIAIAVTAASTITVY